MTSAHAPEPEEPPPRGPLEAWPRPQHGERDEGQDEHGRRGPAEEPGRDRQVGAPDEAVRGGRLRRDPEARQGAGRAAQDDGRPRAHGLTVSLAIWVEVASTSISNTPSCVARRSKRAGLPGATSRLTS